MAYLPAILLTIFFISLILDYLSNIKTKNAMEVVMDMGIGYNLGNTFDSYSIFGGINTPNDQITFYGNKVPTKDMIKRIKKYGFKTIRFPITWKYFIDDNGNVNPDWMNCIKEVIDLIIKENMYCIINIHHDGKYGNWLSKGLDPKNKFINLWKQIANEFKDYDDHLIFESMNEVYYEDSKTATYNYTKLFILNQAFVDTIRSSGGSNIERLLLIAGAYDDIDWTCSSNYKMPIDPSNKLAISIHYYLPTDFTKDTYFEPFSWIDNNGIEYKYKPTLKWGHIDEYYKMLSDFEIMKNIFINKGIPIIIGEIGVNTEERKEIESIREYLYVLFSISSDADGIMSCLWDTSNKMFGEMNYYDREKDIWYDEKLKENFLQISKGKYVKPIDFYIKTHFETVTIPFYDGTLYIKIGVRKVLKIIINTRLTGVLFMDLDFVIYTSNKKGGLVKIDFGKENGKKQYDGTNIFTIDVSKIDCFDFIEVTKSKGGQYIIFNNLTLEFEESFLSINYESYKNSISNYIY